MLTKRGVSFLAISRVSVLPAYQAVNIVNILKNQVTQGQLNSYLCHVISKFVFGVPSEETTHKRRFVLFQFSSLRIS
jgi:hypothetical protein